MGNKASQQQSQAGQNVQTSATSPDSVQVKLDQTSSGETMEIPFTCSLGGGNGWPSEVTVVLYHQVMGVLVVGTESGTVYAYGDGFQYMKADLGAIDITSIVEFDTDKIIVTFADNSMAVLALPSLALLTRLDNWLGKSCGDITVVYSNYILSQNYIFVGTSEGFVRVIEIVGDGNQYNIRECDYTITSANAGVSTGMVASSLQLCPKDEKYLAISYDSYDGSSPDSSGVTIIYDLSKKKVHRTYKSDGVTCIAWNHIGDVLYAGTRQGDVFALGLEKNSCLNVWNVKSEINEDYDDDEGKMTSVRKMIWMGPQQSNDVGCLFVLIGSFGSDTEHLKSVIVALTPNLLNNSIELEQVMSVPPILGVEVVGFRVVSTLDHSSESEEKNRGVPGLLLLGQSESSDGEGVVRELLMLQCPASKVTEWSMELGLLPEPRPAMEVLPGKKAISCMKGIIPDPSTESMSFKLLQMLQDDDTDMDNTTSRFVRMRAHTQSAQVSLTAEITKETETTTSSAKKGGRRRSTRDFFSDINAAILQMETMAEQVDTWALTLATAVEDSAVHADMDVVFVGHLDGSVIVWASSLPPEQAGQSGCGNTWIPVTAIKCGTQEIACIEVCPSKSMVGICDTAGNLSIWQIESLEFKRVSSTLLDSRITSMTFSDDGLHFVAGTEEGSLYKMKDISNKGEMVKIESLDHIGAAGSVMKALVAPYWNGTSYTYAIYVIYKSGHYGVVDVNTHQLLSFCSSGSNPIDLSEGNDGSDDDDDDSHDGALAVNRDVVVYACIMNEKFEIITTVPEPSVTDTPPKAEVVTPVQEVTPTNVTPEQPKKGFGFFKKGNTPPPSATITPPRDRGSVGGGMSSPVFPAASPRYFVYLRGRYLVTCDLHKFGLPSVSERSSAIVFSPALPHAVNMKCISERSFDGTFVAAQDINIIEDSTRFWSQPIPCLSTLDSEGNVKILSIPSGALMSSSTVLPDVFTEEYAIKSSVILPNGNIYLSTSNFMIYSSTPENVAYPQTNAVPCRAAPGYTVPPQSQMLHVTIGNKDAASHMKTKNEKITKRRSSAISFAMSGPVDFQKIFSKSLDSRKKEDLFGSSTSFNEEDEEDEDEISSANVKGSQGKAAATKAALDETRQAFDERGERLNRLTKKMEDFHEGAKIYKKQSAAHKEKMRKKAERWGAF